MIAQIMGDLFHIQLSLAEQRLMSRFISIVAREFRQNKSPISLLRKLSVRIDCMCSEKSAP